MTSTAAPMHAVSIPPAPGPPSPLSPNGCSIANVAARPVSPLKEEPQQQTFVSILDGKHKGKTLRFVKRTARRIAVELENGTIAYLIPSHVNMKSEAAPQNFRAPAKEEPALIEDEEDYEFVDAIEDFPEEEKVEKPLPSQSSSNSFPRERSSVSGATIINETPAEKKELHMPTSSPSPRKFASQELVVIASGSHAGKHAIFVKYTQQRVAVTLADDPESKTRYLMPSSLQPIMKYESERTVEKEEKPSLPISTSASVPNTVRKDQESMKKVSNMNASSVLRDEGQSLSSSSFPMEAPPSQFVPGEKIVITSGAHKDKSATFVKYTELRVAVTLDDDSENKIRYLMPNAITHITQPQRKMPAVETRSSSNAATAYSKTTVDDHENDIIVQAFNAYFQTQSQRKVEVRNCTAIKIKETLFGAIFKDDAVFVEVDTDSTRKLPQEIRLQQDGETGTRMIFLADVKVHQKEKTVTCAYLHAESNEEVRDRILRLGSYDKLAPSSKTAARLELLLSTAAKCNLNVRDYHIHTMNASDFCMIQENGNVGCGFIPRKMIERFLGTWAVGTRSFALQVRIVIPSMGTFKGVLMEKPNIDKIELPPSMKKVGEAPSNLAVGDESAWLMINQGGIFPYKNRIDQQNGGFCEATEIPEQARWMLTQKGVSNSYLSKANQHHSNLIGVADPTSCLPSGSVFITGSQRAKDLFGENVVISRFPMTEASDGVILPIVREMPPSMSEEAWKFLCDKPFGVVIFGNPESGQRALPEHIAQGDLDGDGYFVCWDPVIIQDALIGDRPIFSTKKKSAVDSSPSSWWTESQSYMMDQGGRNQRNQLVGVLCNLWKSKLQDKLQQEALGYGRAYKEAIDVKKHGGKVDLPSELWKDVPSNLHQYLKAQ